MGLVTGPNLLSAGPFDGPDSLRVSAEWTTLFWSVAAIGITAPLLAFVFPSLASPKQIALLLIGAMIYVTFARGRLIGSSIRVHPGQFGHVFEIALECSRALRIAVPNVFIRDDPLVPIVAVGMGEPYSLIISAQWVDHFTSSELRFLIGRELAHIAAGHTRITSLLSVNGRENAVVSILFGAWLRRIEYTADRAGLLCCESLDEALSAISVSTFHLVGRKIDLAAFAEQQREIEAERALRVGEWVSSTPYATKRIAALRRFARDALYLLWCVRFEQSRATPFRSAPLPEAAISRRAFASFPRRVAAFIIDSIVVEAIIPNSPIHITVDRTGSSAGVPAWLLEIAKHAQGLHAVDSSGGWGSLVLLAYVVLLVGLVGQTFGMMILDLRVVSERFERIGIARAMLRYVCLIGSLAAIVGFARIFARLQPFERWSGTRLIEAGAYARHRARTTAPVEAGSP